MTVDTNYLRRLADDLDESGRVETAKDIRAAAEDLDDLRTAAKAALAALETPGDLTEEEIKGVIEDLELVLPEEDGCDKCGAPLDDGEGWDGRCGSCADQAEGGPAGACPECGGTNRVRMNVNAGGQDVEAFVCQEDGCAYADLIKED